MTPVLWGKYGLFALFDPLHREMLKTYTQALKTGLKLVSGDIAMYTHNWNFSTVEFIQQEYSPKCYNQGFHVSKILFWSNNNQGFSCLRTRKFRNPSQKLRKLLIVGRVGHVQPFSRPFVNG